MPGTYTGMTITRDNYMEMSKKILATYITYYANSAVDAVDDGLDAWGSWVTVNAKPSEDAKKPVDLKDHVHISLDRVVSVDSIRGSHKASSGLDEVMYARLNMAITLTTHRSSVYRLDEIAAKLRELIINHHSELAAVEVRDLRLTNGFVPVMADADPARATMAFLLEYKVAYLTKVHHA